jgi:hypothetical protein
VPSSGIIDLAIGLTFVFGVTAALASIATELIARLIGLRAAYLLSGLRELVDGGAARTDLSQAERDYENVQDMIRRRTTIPAEPGPPPAGTPSATGALLGGPILRSQGMTGQVTSRKLTLAATSPANRLPKMAAGRAAGSLWRQRRSLPSYISAGSFADAVIDLVVPGPAGQVTMATIQQGLGALPPAMSPLKASLEALAKNSGDDLGRFRASVEQWYDDHMDRVSGWYKRRVAAITLATGAILVILLNVNALTIGRALYTESTVSAAISNVAAKVSSCPPAESQQDCLADVQARLSAAATAGLPIGWGTVSDCRPPEGRCNWLDQRGILSRHGNSGGQLALVIIGFLVVLTALVPGAQFWFSLLSKLSILRATGPKPTTGRI